MKTKTKSNIFLFLICMLFITTFIIGAIAYLTDIPKTINNTFTVGHVKIKMVETKVDAYGVALKGDTAGTTSQGQAYKLIPGHEYMKNPTITVIQGSTPCWLFVKVTNGISKYEAKYNTIESQLISNGWSLVTGESDVYYYYTVIDAGESEEIINVFDKFVIADDAESINGWESVTSDNTKVSVTAYAIQADGFQDPISAWNIL